MEIPYEPLNKPFGNHWEIIRNSTTPLETQLGAYENFRNFKGFQALSKGLKSISIP